MNVQTSWYDTWTFRGAGTGVSLRYSYHHSRYLFFFPARNCYRANNYCLACQFFNTTNTQEHAFLRKRVAGAYSKSAIMTQESSVQEVFDHLWRQFRQFAKDGQEIDLQVWANYLAFDVVGKLGMGGPIGFIEGGDTKGILHAVHQIFYVAASSGYLPGQMLWLQWPIVQVISDFFGAAQGFKLFQEWSRRQVRSRVAEGPPKGSQRPRDLLDHFISMKEPDGQSATEPSVLAEVGNLIGAGADTAAVGIAVVMAQLMEHPEDLARLRREIDDAYAKADLSSEDSAGLGVRELEKLPFLNACVQEATRLCPSILWQLPREAPEAGFTIAGHYIPPSATLGMSPIAHNRSKEIFGDDADEWRPQRWVPAEDHGDGVATKSDRQRKMEKYNVTVSGAEIPTYIPKAPRLTSHPFFLSSDTDPGSASGDTSLPWR